MVSCDVNVVSLLETARLYAMLGNAAEARAWYYRAYRADFLYGGPEYAIFLASQGEDRECEKVMLYVLSNARKSGDLIRIASVIVDEKAGMRQLRRLLDLLIKRLDEQQGNAGFCRPRTPGDRVLSRGSKRPGGGGLCGMQVLCPLRDGCDAGPGPGNPARGLPPDYP